VELRGAGGAELENEADGVGTGDLDSRRRECHGKSCPGGVGLGEEVESGVRAGGAWCMACAHISVWHRTLGMLPVAARDD